MIPLLQKSCRRFCMNEVFPTIFFKVGNGIPVLEVFVSVANVISKIWFAAWVQEFPAATFDFIIRLVLCRPRAAALSSCFYPQQ
ncbi:hypothetical protein SUGI_0420310 [Cryptomeria japonica]|nr:hypothetical protein SUGI_0420310 [Cryptomeria japonica]